MTFEYKIWYKEYYAKNHELLKSKVKKYYYTHRTEESERKRIRYYQNLEQSRLNERLKRQARPDLYRKIRRKSYYNLERAKPERSIGITVKPTEYKHPSYFQSRYRRSNGHMPGVNE